MKKRKSLLRRLIKLFIIVTIFAVGGVFIYIKTAPKLMINNANNILLYDSNNNVFFEGSQSKKWTSLDDISNYLIDSTIYTEDKNFYKHFGFDFFRIAKASYVNITNHSTSQGASTITQQYAKNLFLSFDKTWKRKWNVSRNKTRTNRNY